MKKIIIILVALILIMTGLSGCVTKNETDEDHLKELAETQITDYEGKDLSSILEFRDNSIKGTQQIDIEAYKLTIDGLVDTPLALTYDEVLSHQSYTKLVTLYCVEGWDVDILWEGILLKDLFVEAGVQSDAVTVIFHSEDGYTTSLPLQTILDKNIMIAYNMNGLELPPELGFPFQLVAEEKLGYKWAKWITRIELSSDANYKGYWEQRGYSNEADVED